MSRPFLLGRGQGVGGAGRGHPGVPFFDVPVEIWHLHVEGSPVESPLLVV